MVATAYRGEVMSACSESFCERCMGALDEFIQKDIDRSLTEYPDTVIMGPETLTRIKDMEL